MAPQHSPVIIVHGGAYDIPQEAAAAHLRDVKHAARVGHAALRAGASALDAVEAAIRAMEASATFTAGKGAPPTSAGTVELDAAVMTDAPALGAVGAVSTVEHPISLARLVAERSNAVFLVGAGAEQFARDMRVPEVDASSWLSDAARRDLSDHLASQPPPQKVADGTASPDDVASLADAGAHDTVGAVALDLTGRIAAGTSTGGLPYCRPGRVGDSPIAGSGLYVQRGVGGVSTTGHGESIFGTVMAKHAVDLVAMKGESLQDAARDAVAHTMSWSRETFAGIIGLDYDGGWCAEFDAPSMAWACVDANAELKACVGRGMDDYGSVLDGDLHGQ